MHESPYPPHRGPGVAARVVLRRDAKDWLPDIEAYLVERQLSTELAPAVASLMNAFGCSADWAIERIAVALQDPN